MQFILWLLQCHMILLSDYYKKIKSYGNCDTFYFQESLLNKVQKNSLFEKIIINKCLYSHFNVSLQYKYIFLNKQKYKN